MTFPALPPLAPFHLLEINLISAQDLASVSRGMRTYAVAWIHPDRKLSTRVDTQGRADPIWNDKLVFRVDDSFLKSDNSILTIEIYAISWFRDAHVGGVRVLVHNLLSIPSSKGPSSFPARFVALQVRRPSGRPQGILNMGVALLDRSMRSMPLYDPYHHAHPSNPLPQLRPSRSEHRSETAEGSELAAKATWSVWSDSELGPSASFVAPTKATETFFPAEEFGISVLEDWSVAESSGVGAEGLKSKLERWRMELPPIYDPGVGSFRSSSRKRRSSEGGKGLFSCFGDSCGCECSFVCGLNPRKGVPGAENIHLSPSNVKTLESYN